MPQKIRQRGRGKKLRTLGWLSKKALKFGMKKAPGYAKKILNSSAGQAAKNFVREKIGNKAYQRLAKGANVIDQVLANNRVQEIGDRFLN